MALTERDRGGQLLSSVGVASALALMTFVLLLSGTFEFRRGLAVLAASLAIIAFLATPWLPKPGLSLRAFAACLGGALPSLRAQPPVDAWAVAGGLLEAMGFFFVYRDVLVPRFERPYRELARANQQHRLDLTLQKARQQQLFDSSLDAMFLCKPDAAGGFRYLDVNRAFERLAGISRAELIGKTTEETGTTDLTAVMARCARAGTTLHEEASLRLGPATRILCSMVPLKDAAGTTAQIAGSLRDLTEQKRLEEALVAERTFHETVVLKASVGLAVYRADGTCLVVNEAFARMVGSSREQLGAENFRKSESWKKSGLVELALSTLGTGWPSQRPAHFVTASDRDVWAEQQLVRVFLGGQPHLLVLLVDATEAHLKAEALSQARRQLQRATGVAEIGVWVQELTDGTLHWDDQMFELFQVPTTSRGALLNQDTWRDRCHPEDLARATAELARGIQGDAPFTFDFRIVLPGGALRLIHAAAVVERDREGKPVRVIGINKDITQDREREEELARAKRAADEVSHSKSAFLTHASAELRAPLATVAGLTELVLDSELGEAQRRYLERIRLASKAATNIASDLLDYSRIEAGELELEEADFTLEEVLRDTAARCGPRAEEMGSELVFEVAPETPLRVRGDPSRVGHLIDNLVGHAVAHSASGEVRVVVERAVGGAGLLLTVSGSAMKVARGEIERLLGLSGEAAPLTAAGEDLGLALSGRLVRLMNGEIGVESGDGGRCTLRVFLPLPPAVGRSGLHALKELGPLRTLVVDDRDTSRRAISALLESWSFEVTVARSGPRGLHAMEEAGRAGRPFELLLVDCRMPGMDGLDFARRARALMGAWGGPTVVMMATSFGHERVVKAGRAEGIDAIVEKPVFRSQLFDVLSELQYRRRPANSN